MIEGAAAVMISTILADRGPARTICPSEVARALVDHGDNWRMAMPDVHAAVDALLAEKAIRVSWRGQRLEARSGPYRIGELD